jgi:hypothetical protein
MLDPQALALTLIPLARVPIPGAEIPAFDRASQRLLVTSGPDVHAFEFEVPSRPRGVGFVRLGSLADDVTHVATDPARRGFAAACLVPERFAARHGYVAFFDPATLKEVARVAVGHNPDSCAFTPGGEFLVVANEGQAQALESGQIIDPPGSVTVIDLRRVRSAADLSNLGDAPTTTMLMSGAALDAALHSDMPPRIAPRNRETPVLDLEPEYIVAPTNTTAYVSLQENNAIAEITLDPPGIARITGLGSVPRDLDGSDRDGPLGSSWTMNALPMPDQIASFKRDGERYFVLAEEGDTRGEMDASDTPTLADTARVSDLASWWGSDEVRVPAGLLEPHRLGRLHILTDMADMDGDGSLDTMVVPGTRSLGVYAGDSMRRVGDTGSSLEIATLSLFADDSRSDDRGPEPEGVALADVSGSTIAFVSIERPGAIATIDLSIPDRPTLLSVYPSAWEGDRGPEGMCLIEAPGGDRFLAVCYETSGTLVVYAVTTGPR